MVIIVVGGTGQLGQCLSHVTKESKDITFHFLSEEDLDITHADKVNAAFEKYKPNYCINAAAYTAVDKAEEAVELATAINVTAVEYLAKACATYNTTLLHVSTDFVFDGKNSTPYTETDIPGPLGVYGQTKLDGELVIPELLKRYYIVRTSWLYSPFAANFMKTMIRLGSERDTLSVVNDQIGTPTQALDLAAVLVHIIKTDISGNHPYGLYHFSNEGQCSWYDFAEQIFINNNIKIDLKPIPTSAYPTPAERPKYSVLDKSKIKNTFGITIRSWEEGLKNPFNE